MAQSRFNAAGFFVVPGTHGARYRRLVEGEWREVSKRKALDATRNETINQVLRRRETERKALLERVQRQEISQSQYDRELAPLLRGKLGSKQRAKIPLYQQKIREETGKVFTIQQLVRSQDYQRLKKELKAASKRMNRAKDKKIPDAEAASVLTELLRRLGILAHDVQINEHGDSGPEEEAAEETPEVEAELEEALETPPVRIPPELLMERPIELTVEERVKRLTRHQKKLLDQSLHRQFGPLSAEDYLAIIMSLEKKRRRKKS